VVVTIVVAIVIAIVAMVSSTGAPAMAATTLEDLVIIPATRSVVRITVQGMTLTDHMVRQQRLEVFLTIR